MGNKRFLSAAPHYTQTCLMKSRSIQNNRIQNSHSVMTMQREGWMVIGLSAEKLLHPTDYIFASCEAMEELP